MTFLRQHPSVVFADQTPADHCVLDVRTRPEVEAQALADCLHIPLQELSVEKLQAVLTQKGLEPDILYLLCQSGKRAEAAAQLLSGALGCRLCILEGGVNAAVASGIPLLPRQSQRTVISLERQVRIAAGFLAVLGVVLGTFVHPGFYGVSALVGAGLMMAGITDSCLLGMLMARMTWNR